MPTEAQTPSAGSDHAVQYDSDALSHALAELRRAAESRRVEPLCTAYQHLRIAARGMRLGELFRIVDREIEAPVENVLVSAYSHRHCFMCDDGTSLCAHCEGTGYVEENRLCPQCGGLGLTPCGFCEGTGWADRQNIPPEFRKAVLDRQLAHVRRDLQRAGETLAKATRQAMDSLSATDRRALLAWLLRLQCRMSHLAGLDDLGDSEQQARLGAMATRIEKCLEKLARG
ncbi:MAG TPA: hypothetical protein PK082_05240 [Phycisphaerae bacterium]|nr:hypothetical protein [Phycisphaerae bacterium]